MNYIYTVKIEPNFKPLLKHFPEKIVGNFMYIGAKVISDNSVLKKGSVIYDYKHRDTRNYISIDDSGNCYSGNALIHRVWPIETSDAYKKVFKGLDKLNMKEYNEIKALNIL